MVLLFIEFNYEALMSCIFKAYRNCFRYVILRLLFKYWLARFLMHLDRLQVSFDGQIVVLDCKDLRQLHGQGQAKGTAF